MIMLVVVRENPLMCLPEMGIFYQPLMMGIDDPWVLLSEKWWLAEENQSTPKKFLHCHIFHNKPNVGFSMIEPWSLLWENGE
jgi:hypothetical protein